MKPTQKDLEDWIIKENIVVGSSSEAIKWMKFKLYWNKRAEQYHKQLGWVD